MASSAEYIPQTRASLETNTSLTELFRCSTVTGGVSVARRNVTLLQAKEIMSEGVARDPSKDVNGLIQLAQPQDIP